MDKMQCPHCGTMNEVGRSLCMNCQTPLTAYGGELKGEAFQGKLAGQVEQLKSRPPVIYAMTVFLAVIALGWPLRAVVTVIINRTQINAEGTNYLAAALGSIAPILITALCLPLAILLGWFAWAVWTQREWAWKFSLGALVLFATYILFRRADYHGWVFLWVGLSVVLLVLWFQSRTKAWFGMF